MQSVFTKYYGPANVRDARIKVWASGNPQNAVFYNYPDESKDPHRACAISYLKLLAIKHGGGWYGVWVEGDTKDGKVYVNNRHNDTITI